MGAIEVEINALANQVRMNRSTAVILITLIVIVYCFLCVPLVVWCVITINKRYQVQEENSSNQGSQNPYKKPLSTINEESREESESDDNKK